MYNNMNFFVQYLYCIWLLPRETVWARVPQCAHWTGGVGSKVLWWRSLCLIRVSLMMALIGAFRSRAALRCGQCFIFCLRQFIDKYRATKRLLAVDCGAQHAQLNRDSDWVPFGKAILDCTRATLVKMVDRVVCGD